MYNSFILTFYVYSISSLNKKMGQSIAFPWNSDCIVFCNFVFLYF